MYFWADRVTKNQCPCSFLEVSDTIKIESDPNTIIANSKTKKPADKGKDTK